MNQRRHRTDHVLFISALAILLLGVAFLLYTTRTFIGVPRFWPIMVIVAGGILFYFALVRGASLYILSGGIFFVLEGAFFLSAVLLDWEIAKAWPVGMTIAGITGLVSGIVAKKKLKPLFAVPSIGFAILGLIFSAFSFGLTRVSFKSFIMVWWPTLLIIGGISLFVAYGLSRRARAKSKHAHDAQAEGPKRERGPSSGP